MGFSWEGGGWERERERASAEDGREGTQWPAVRVQRMGGSASVEDGSEQDGSFWRASAAGSGGIYWDLNHQRGGWARPRMTENAPLAR